MEKLLKEYGISEGDLAYLIGEVSDLVQSYGIEVRYVDMGAVIEQNVLPMESDAHPFSAEEKHHETAISDGHTLYLHRNLEDFGLAGRLYDLLHMGAGHVWQWSASAESGLEFHSELGWDLGSKFHLGAAEEVLQQVHRYELESSCIALGNLEIVLGKDHTHSDKWKQHVRQFMNDYLRTDLEYIVDYYRTGVVYEFIAQWRWQAPMLPVIEPNFSIRPHRRNNLCIPLIVM